MESESVIVYNDDKKSGRKKSSAKKNEEILKNAELINILKEISEKENIDQTTADGIIQKLKVLYDGTYRHSYYLISAEMYKMNNKQLDCISTGIQFIKSRISRNNAHAYQGVRKLYDHIQLEIIRIKETNNRNQKSEEISMENLTTIQHMISSYRDEMNEMKKEQESQTEKYDSKINESLKNVNNIYTQIVGILGIFAAVVIVFFAGTSVFANVFSNLRNLKWREVMPIIAVVGAIMFNVIFMFLFIVSRMLDRDIGVKIDAESKIKNRVLMHILRYPYVFAFNIGILMLFMITA